MKTAQVEVWVMIDSDGDYAVARDNDDLAQAYDDQVGGDRDTIGLRRVKVTLTVPVPEVVELSAAIPAEGPPSELRVA